MFTILSDGEIEAAWRGDRGCSIREAERKVAKAEQKNTLKQVIERLEEWQREGTHLISNQAIEELKKAG